jgi:hypothetical protein
MTETAAPNLVDMSANASPIFTLFEAETVTELRRDHLTRLASGVLGAVLVKGFAHSGQCAQIMHGLENHPLGSYDPEVVYPPVAKLGPAAYDFYGAYELNDQYWEFVDRAVAIRRTLLGGGDPLVPTVGKLRAAWGAEVQPATANGRPLFAGMVRETTTGMKMHFDEIVRELPGAIDAPPISQLAFNLYISMPEGGGDTRVYRRRWRPADEGHRDGYGWSEQMVADEPYAQVRPETGDAVIFDPRNYHAVRPNVGAGRRVSLSFFLGVTGSGPLNFWS